MHAMNDKKVIYLVQATAALTAVVVDSKCHELSHVVPIVHGTLPITPYGLWSNGFLFCLFSSFSSSV